jgi:tRNA-2-methylthio-N6-dimethylallyladenosine synthase
VSKSVYIKTYGCQMNEHDTQRMFGMLAPMDFISVNDPEEADLILLNTCSVRANPENKVYSFLGALRPLKERKPGLIIGVAGCVAQQVGKSLLKRAPHVDFVLGPDNLFRLPEFVEDASHGKRGCYTDWQTWEGSVSEFVPEVWQEQGRVEGLRGYIAITKGCNNYCSYCIVPHTRGREVSRSPEGILREARSMIKNGAKEIWLLGQNVNSYQVGEDYGFYELLDELSHLEGLLRLRFTSPHPRDWNDRLSDLMAARPVLCNYVHLPFQAGSDTILMVMRRKHSIADYLRKIDYLRRVIPTVEISTDLIVGFPGETDEDFTCTLQVLEEVRFSQVFPFKYSVRPGTRAESLEDDVPRKVKEERLAQVISLQESINKKAQDDLVGSQQTVLLEDTNKRKEGFYNGRTDGFRAITVAGDGLSIGALVHVCVTGCKGHWLHAEKL